MLLSCLIHPQEFCNTCTREDGTQAAASAGTDGTRRMLYTSGNPIPFPFGSGAGDQAFARNDDGSIMLNLVEPITIYGTAYNSLSMNNNGE
jgi:hypothetical protein